MVFVPSTLASTVHPAILRLHLILEAHQIGQTPLFEGRGESIVKYHATYALANRRITVYCAPYPVSPSENHTSRIMICRTSPRSRSLLHLLPRWAAYRTRRRLADACSP